MFRVLVFAATPEVATGLGVALVRSGRFGPVRSADSSQLYQKAEQILRINAPDVVFIEAGRNLDVEAHGQFLSELQPGLPVVAFGRAASWEYLLKLIRAGVCEYLATPINDREVLGLAERLGRLVKNRPNGLEPVGQLFSFLPAKPGAGASSIAMNTSAALAQQFNTRTLLADLDFSAGIISFALNVKPEFSVLDALPYLPNVQHEMWAKIVVEKGNLHVLPAPDTPATENADLSRFMEIIHIGRRLHDVVCVDLSGGLEDFTLDVMQESKQIFVVCSLETPVLHLARRRIARLSQLGLRDRLSVIVNRWNPRSEITLQHVSEMLGLPVFATVCNDYTELQKAFNGAMTVSPNSRLGRDFTALAARMGGHLIPRETGSRRLVARLSEWLFPGKKEKPEPAGAELGAPLLALPGATTDATNGVTNALRAGDSAVEPAITAVDRLLAGAPRLALTSGSVDPLFGLNFERKYREKTTHPFVHHLGEADPVAPQKIGRSLPRNPIKPRAPLSDEDIKTLIACCETSTTRAAARNKNQLRALILLLWETGLPLGDVVQMTTARLEASYLGDGDRPAISSAVGAALDQCTVSDSGYIFGEPTANAVGTWRRRLNDLGRRAGISDVAARFSQPRAASTVQPNDSVINLVTVAEEDHANENSLGEPSEASPSYSTDFATESSEFPRDSLEFSGGSLEYTPDSEELSAEQLETDRDSLEKSYG